MLSLVQLIPESKKAAIALLTILRNRGWTCFSGKDIPKKVEYLLPEDDATILLLYNKRIKIVLDGYKFAVPQIIIEENKPIYLSYGSSYEEWIEEFRKLIAEEVMKESKKIK